MLIHNVGAPLVNRVPRSFIRNGTINRAAMYRTLVENAVLREDATRQIEETLTAVARRDLVAVADLRAAGLTVPLNNIGITSYEFDRVAPVGEATQGMSILSLGDRDLVAFTRTAIPVPVTASQFEMDARMQAAGGNIGESVSLTNVEEHTRAVAEKLEDTLCNGSDVVLGSNTLPGYINHGSRAQVTLSAGAWTSATGFAGAVADLLACKAALADDGFRGPYIFYAPSNWDLVLDEDYSTLKGDRTLRQRLLAIEGVTQVKVLPALPSDNALLVQMTRSVVQMAIGQDITVVTWDTFGGLATNWAILAVMAAAIKTANARAPLSASTLAALTTAAGIAHLS
jgi:hypothetical protein